MAKVCCIVVRAGSGDWLAFRHPTAGLQWVKGTIGPNEASRDAAIRELREESGIIASAAPRFLASALIGTERTRWDFWLFEAEGLPDRWTHQTEDDHGHRFHFFWHPAAEPMTADWDPMFREAHRVAAEALGS